MWSDDHVPTMDYETRRYIPVELVEILNFANPFYVDARVLRDFIFVANCFEVLAPLTYGRADRN